MKEKIKNNKKIFIGAIAAIILCVAGIVFFAIYTKTEWDFEIHTDEKYRTYQNFWVCDAALMASEDGYYYAIGTGDTKKIYHITKDAKSAEIICNKANCRHRDKTCPAVWDNSNSSNMQYNNGYFFYSQRDEDGEYYLYRCQKDGTDRKQIVDLGSSNEKIITSVTVSGNHIFVVELVMSDGLYRFVDYNMENYRKLGYKNTFYETNDCMRIHITDISNGKVLYNVNKNTKDLMREYDYVKKEDRLVKEIEGSFGYAHYVDDSIVYSSNKYCKMFKLSDPETEKELISNSGGFSSYCDGKIYVNYISLFDENLKDYSKNEVRVFDKTGELLDTIPMPEDKQIDLLVCYFGDEPFLFTTTFGTDKLYVYDKANIGKGEGDWWLLRCK